jgi:hypothetical protein
MSMLEIYLWLLALVLAVSAIAWAVSRLARWARQAGDGGRDELDAEREALAVQWAALEQARRVNEVFFAARDRLREAEAEAQRFGQSSPPRSRPAPQGPEWPTVIDGEWS